MLVSNEISIWLDLPGASKRARNVAVGVFKILNLHGGKGLDHQVS